ncbi:MAG TPA: hypothetical protein EYP10_11885 [Armatimonadetes bacterium]|nr:hypothetical protein [Armatimonadota bacterium]
MQMVMFAKHLQELGLERMADAIADLELDGVDLTVRPGGSILPEEAKAKLPDAMKIFNARGLTIGMITTAITSVDEPYADEIVATAGELGIRYLKLGYWLYKGFGTLRAGMDAMRRDLDGLAKLAQRHEVTFGVHLHSGDFLSADAAIVFMLINEFNPEHVCAYIDPGHMAIEGGRGGWCIGMDILRDYIRMVAIKDFAWVKDTDAKTGEAIWRIEAAPLRDGITPWKRVFNCLREIGFDGCISIHSEYHGMSAEEIVKQTHDDLAYLRPIINTTLRH